MEAGSSCGRTAGRCHPNCWPPASSAEARLVLISGVPLTQGGIKPPPMRETHTFVQSWFFRMTHGGLFSRVLSLRVCVFISSSDHRKSVTFSARGLPARLHLFSLERSPTLPAQVYEDQGDRTPTRCRRFLLWSLL